MSGRPFRFVHASDFHLEQPPFGISDIPDSLRDALVDAPYRAAQRVFDLAAHEAVDFLLLCGDILSPSAGHRGWAFLLERFDELAERGIAVYWTGGAVDPPDAWPAGLELPENVNVFGDGEAELVTHRQGGEPLCHILGLSSPARGKTRASDFSPPDDGLFTIAMAHGKVDTRQLARQMIDYWALGGEHARRTLLTAPTLAHYCGTPQGRSPREAGPRGCTIVEVDEAGKARATPFQTDTVRWQHERLLLPESVQPDAARRKLAEHEDLQRMLAARAQALLSNHAGPDLLVTWAVQASAATAADLRGGALAGDLLSRLRADFAARRPALWSVSLQVSDEPAGGEQAANGLGEQAAEDSAVDALAIENTATDERTVEQRIPKHLFEQETILGEFLRTLRQWEGDPAASIELEPLLGQTRLTGSLARAVEMSDAAVRRRVLRDVATLGVDLLSGEEPRT